MNWSQGGDFTKSLVSIQLQLQTLLEDVGGENAAELMDAVAKLHGAERKTVLPILIRVIRRLAENNDRLCSKDDIKLKEFEDSLYESVVAEMSKAALNTIPAEEKRLSVVKGGRAQVLDKPVRISTLIDLAKARDERRGWKRV